jgi:hypothetical protein
MKAENPYKYIEKYAISRSTNLFFSCPSDIPHLFIG